MRRQAQFVLQFGPSDIDDLVEQYDSAQDDNAIKTGNSVPAGLSDTAVSGLVQSLPHSR